MTENRLSGIRRTADAFAGWCIRKDVLDLVAEVERLAEDNAALRRALGRIAGPARGGKAQQRAARAALDAAGGGGCDSDDPE